MGKGHAGTLQAGRTCRWPGRWFALKVRVGPLTAIWVMVGAGTIVLGDVANLQEVDLRVGIGAGGQRVQDQSLPAGNYSQRTWPMMYWPGPEAS